MHEKSAQRKNKLYGNVVLRILSWKDCSYKEEQKNLCKIDNQKEEMREIDTDNFSQSETACCTPATRVYSL